MPSLSTTSSLHFIRRVDRPSWSVSAAVGLLSPRSRSVPEMRRFGDEPPEACGTVWSWECEDGALGGI